MGEEEKNKKGKPGTYLRQVTTGLCYAWSSSKDKRGDMEPWTGPLPWEGGKVEPKLPEGHGEVVNEPSADYRAEQIRAAVAQIEPKNYGQAGFGYPAMPKVQAISCIVGFDVTRDEIFEAMSPPVVKDETPEETKEEEGATGEEEPAKEEQE